jgi:3-methyladenine DNA glycosylase AlkC
MAEAPLLKDFVDRKAVAAVAESVAAAAPGVDADHIVRDVFDAEWEERALKQRFRHIAVTVRSHLPEEYPEALAIMRRAATILDAGWTSAWAFNDFVEEFGVEFPDESLPALEQFTKLASAEFAVRPFIKQYPERMADQMLSWAHDDDAAVRRLASEGYRPRLPWGMGIPSLKQDPTRIIAVLEILRSDPSEDVRRSVANSLNDISRDHPDLVVNLLASWADDSAEMVALTKHALRTLVKQGQPAALELIGFSPNPQVELMRLDVAPSPAAVGDATVLDLELRSSSEEAQNLLLDFAVVYQTASGGTSRKVFKGKVVTTEPGEVIAMRRKVSLAQRTTRRIFPGPHAVEIQVNGVPLGAVQFDVIA